jgi:hypothetical protein
MSADHAPRPSPPIFPLPFLRPHAMFHTSCAFGSPAPRSASLFAPSPCFHPRQEGTGLDRASQWGTSAVLGTTPKGRLWEGGGAYEENTKGVQDLAWLGLDPCSRNTGRAISAVCPVVSLGEGRRFSVSRVRTPALRLFSRPQGCPAILPLTKAIPNAYLSPGLSHPACCPKGVAAPRRSVSIRDNERRSPCPPLVSGVRPLR